MDLEEIFYCAITMQTLKLHIMQVVCHHGILVCTSKVLEKLIIFALL